MYRIEEYMDKYNTKINDFVISIYVEEYGFEEHRSIIENDDNSVYSKQGGNFWIALDNNNDIIGTIAVYKLDEKSVELKRLYVRKDYRGKGLSKALYEKVIQYCKKNSFNRIFLGTYDKLETAINFYIKRGFKEIENRRETNGARFFELYISNRIRKV